MIAEVSDEDDENTLLTELGLLKKPDDDGMYFDDEEDVLPVERDDNTVTSQATLASAMSVPDGSSTSMGGIAQEEGIFAAEELLSYEAYTYPGYVKWSYPDTVVA